MNTLYVFLLATTLLFLPPTLANNITQQMLKAAAKIVRVINKNAPQKKSKQGGGSLHCSK